MILDQFILHRFCGNGGYDERIATLMSCAGGTLATNSYLMIWLPALIGAPPPHASIAAHIEGLVAVARAAASSNNEWQAAIDISAPPISCENCQGTGRFGWQQCGECDGNGRFTHRAHVYECQSCDGEGFLKVPGNDRQCAHCNGTGIADGASSFCVIGEPELTLNGRLLQLIRLLPNAFLGRRPIRAESMTHLIPLHFDGGGVGVACPYKTAPMATIRSNEAGNAP
jgi:hypothetical protein